MTYLLTLLAMIIFAGALPFALCPPLFFSCEFVRGCDLFILRFCPNTDEGNRAVFDLMTAVFVILLVIGGVIYDKPTKAGGVWPSIHSSETWNRLLLSHVGRADWSLQQEQSWVQNDSF